MEIKTHIPMSRSMKYQKRNHTHFLCSKALGLGVLNKRCVYLQLHDLSQGLPLLVAWARREHHSLSYTPTTPLGAQPVQWLLRAGLLVENGSGKKNQLFLLQVRSNWSETSIDYRCFDCCELLLSINEHQLLHCGQCFLSKLELTIASLNQDLGHSYFWKLLLVCHAGCAASYNWNFYQAILNSFR